MPLDDFRACLPRAAAIVSAGWRYGPRPRGGREPAGDPDGLGRLAPRARLRPVLRGGIRVLSAAPGFAGAVAELALGLALASARDIVSGDRAMRAGEERWLSAADGLETFLLADKRVGLVGFGTSAVGSALCSSRSAARSPPTTHG